MKYSDQLVEWLAELGYTHCFFVAGGNIMHLLESASRKFRCINFGHEVAAGIAAEYFNQIAEGERAFALVTAGPGLTNIVTAMAGAFLESRELLVIGGQVKVPDLSRGKLRQRGIQEIDGVAIARPVAVLSRLVDEVLPREAFVALAEAGSTGRKGPVFLEIPLDIQARQVEPEPRVPASPARAEAAMPDTGALARLADEIRKAERPVLLLGGGVSRAAARGLHDRMASMAVPIMTTWNGADRIESDHPAYFGRPNTWGQRYANLLVQQADLLVALGTRLGLQQTGFNWQEFVPGGRVAQVDLDPAELDKGHPRVAMPIAGDADRALDHLAHADLGRHDGWLAYCREVRSAIPLSEPVNQTRQGYISPYEFCLTLSRLAAEGDIIVPASSGGAFTVMMQAFNQRRGQAIVTNKGLAAMGYGLSGAIGAAIAGSGRRTILVEGDGGFFQNLQEIGTAAINKLNLKIFVFDDGGYASIRMTQKSYFGGRYVGCDRETGLGLPDWPALFGAFHVPATALAPGFADDARFREDFRGDGVAAFVVPIDPEQTYFPKITSRVTAEGGMASNPLHLMTPPLDEGLARKVGRYLPAAG